MWWQLTSKQILCGYQPLWKDHNKGDPLYPHKQVPTVKSLGTTTVPTCRPHRRYLLVGRIPPWEVPPHLPITIQWPYDLQVVCHLVRANWLVHVNHLVRSILSFAAGQNSQLRGAGPTTENSVPCINLASHRWSVTSPWPQNMHLGKESVLAAATQSLL